MSISASQVAAHVHTSKVTLTLISVTPHKPPTVIHDLDPVRQQEHHVASVISDQCVGCTLLRLLSLIVTPHKPPTLIHDLDPAPSLIRRREHLVLGGIPPFSNSCVNLG